MIADFNLSRKIHDCTGVAVQDLYSHTCVLSVYRHDALLGKSGKRSLVYVQTWI